MKEHDYESIAQMQGSMNLSRSPNPKGFSRANYMKILDSWEM
jgi:dihydroorotate dehydrogenase (fumarate)